MCPKLGQIRSATLARTRRNLDRFRPVVGRNRPNSANGCPQSTKVGPRSTTHLARCRPDLARNRPCYPEIGQIRPTLARRLPSLVRIQPSLTQILPSVAHPGRRNDHDSVTCIEQFHARLCTSQGEIGAAGERTSMGDTLGAHTPATRSHPLGAGARGAHSGHLSEV